MIVTKNEQKTTRLTVCKYDSYQEVRNADETQVKRKRNASETQVTPNKNDNNIKNDNNTYTERDFISDWNKTRTEVLNKPSHINRVGFEEKKYNT